MSFPILSTQPSATRRITWWSCALGYLVTLIGVPLAAGSILQVAIWTLKGTGITRTPIGPALQYVELNLELLGYSIVAAYIGAILSVPVVIWARWKGWFGWGTALLTGISVGLIVLGLGFQMRPIEFFKELMLPCALLGLAFWITVRLIHPSAFARK